MENLIKSIFSWLKNLFNLSFLFNYLFTPSTTNSIKLGIRRGLEIPTLPLRIRNFYDNIVIRIFRFIGGICLVLNLTGYYLSFPNILHWFILIISAIQMIQIMIITGIKIVYSIYTLIYNPKIFEIRNSPLNYLATHLGKIILCAKIGCGVGGGAAGIVATGATFDTLLDTAGYNKVFIPFLAEGVKAVFGNSISPKVTIEKTTPPTLSEAQKSTKKNILRLWLKAIKN
jgi:hypothetical protein